MSKSIRALVLFSAGLLASAPPSAADPAYTAVKGMDERFRLDLGAMQQTFETTLRLDSSILGTGTDVSLENDLGQSTRKTSFRANGYWRFGRHGRFEFGFSSWDRSSTQAITRDVQFGDHVYHAGATVDSRFAVTQADVGYAYSIVNTGEWELGLKLGASVLFHKASFDATGFVTGPGGTVSTGSASDSRSVVAPIPVVGAHLRFTLLPGLFFAAQARALPRLTVSSYSGRMLDGGVSLDWYPWVNLGIGAGYDYTRVEFERLTDPVARIDYSYSGPLAYVTFAF